MCELCTSYLPRKIRRQARRKNKKPVVSKNKILRIAKVISRVSWPAMSGANISMASINSKPQPIMIMDSAIFIF